MEGQGKAMRELSADLVQKTVADLTVRAAIDLPCDVEAALVAAQQTETSALGRSALETLVKNAHIARDMRLPLCQDSGVMVVFVDWGEEVIISGGSIESAITQGIADATKTGYLRAGIVADPLRRVNTENNTPPVIHTRLVPGDAVTITVAPKGFGSENMTVLEFLLPHTSQDEIIDKIVAAVARAGSNPCPPVVIGVGLGGVAETCCLAAKRALLREIGSRHADKLYAELETRTLTAVNALNIGPQGFGGSTTALAVHIEPLPTHIAGLPLCVNICCHALRHKTDIL